MALPPGFEEVEATDDYVPAPGPEGVALPPEAKPTAAPMGFMEAMATGGFSGALGGTQPLLSKKAAQAVGASDADAELVRQTMIDKEEQARKEHPGAYYPSMFLTSALGGRAIGGALRAGLAKFAPAAAANLATRAAAHPLAARLLEQGATAGIGSAAATAGQADWRSPLAAAGQTALGGLGGSAVGIALPAWARSSAENLGEIAGAAAPLVRQGAQRLAARVAGGAGAMSADEAAEVLGTLGSGAEVTLARRGDTGLARAVERPGAAVTVEGGRGPRQLNAGEAADTLRGYLPEGAPPRMGAGGGGRGGRLPPGDDVTGESSLAVRTATAGGGGRLPPGGGPRVGAGGGGRVPPTDELAEAGRGVLQEIRDFQLGRRLRNRMSTEALGRYLEGKAPELALNAAGAIKSDLMNIPMNYWDPTGNWMLDVNAIPRRGADKLAINARLQAIRAGARPTETLEELAPNAWQPAEVLQRLQAQLDNMNSRQRETIAPAVRRVMDQIVEESGAGSTERPLASLAQMARLKSSIQSDIPWHNPAASRPVNQALQRAVGVLRDDIDRQAAEQLSPEAFRHYMQQKVDYGMAERLLPITEKAAAGERANNMFGLGSLMAGGTAGSTVGSAVGSALGPIPGAVAGAAAAAAGAGASKLAKERYASVLAPTFRSLGRRLQRAAPGEATSIARDETRETLMQLLRELEDEYGLPRVDD